MEDDKKDTDEILGSCHEERAIGISESDGKDFWRERKRKTTHEIFGWPEENNRRRTENGTDAADDERSRCVEVHGRQRLQ